MQSLKSLVTKAYRHLFLSKHELELSYWKDRYKDEGNQLENGFYRKLMLAIAQEENDDFMVGKMVGDFGCGPRGSLAWVKQASMCIGIDVLAAQYIKQFPKEYLKHNMLYMNCTERSIPMPDDTLDILFTVNALDHTQYLDEICLELKRVLRPGGLLIGSFNLNKKPSKVEPQYLTENNLRMILFNSFEILSWRVSAHGNTKAGENLYEPLYKNQMIAPMNKEAVLWAKAIKL